MGGEGNSAITAFLMTALYRKVLVLQVAWSTFSNYGSNKVVSVEYTPPGSSGAFLFSRRRRAALSLLSFDLQLALPFNVH